VDLNFINVVDVIILFLRFLDKIWVAVKWLSKQADWILEEGIKYQQTDNRYFVDKREDRHSVEILLILNSNIFYQLSRGNSLSLDCSSSVLQDPCACLVVHDAAGRNASPVSLHLIPVEPAPQSQKNL
jgi:hypothetical protein